MLMQKIDTEEALTRAVKAAVKEDTAMGWALVALALDEMDTVAEIDELGQVSFKEAQ